MTDDHGRDHVAKIELALEDKNNFLAFRTANDANVGAYLSNFSTVTPMFLHDTLMVGKYTVPLVYVNVKTVFTNTAPVDAYLGAGRPEATYSLEKVIDIVRGGMSKNTLWNGKSWLKITCSLWVCLSCRRQKRSFSKPKNSGFPL